MEDISYIKAFGTTIIQIYIILNPPTVIAIMLGMTKNNTIAERLHASRQICAIGAVLLFMFSLFGQIILHDIFRISTESFQVGGGLYLFLMGLSMACSKSSEGETDSGEATHNIASLIITPLATPLLVGPGTMTATLVKRMELPNSWGYATTFYLALVFTMIFVYITFILGCRFSKYLKPVILQVIEKLVGILLLCIATSSISKGIKTFLQSM
jgi:multiple antibiotic resistance protein